MRNEGRRQEWLRMECLDQWEDSVVQSLQDWLLRLTRNSLVRCLSLYGFIRGRKGEYKRSIFQIR